MNATEKLKKQNRRLVIWRMLINILIILAFDVAILCVGAYGGIKAMTGDGAFPKDVMIDGIQVGGLPYGEGEALVMAHRDQLMKGKSITVSYDGSDYVFPIEDIGFGTDAKEVLDEAFALNKSGGSIIDDYLKTFEPAVFETKITVNEEALKGRIEEFLSAFYVAPVDARAEFKPATRTFEYVEGTDGSVVNVDKVTAEIVQKVTGGDESPVLAFGERVLPARTIDDLKANTALIGEAPTMSASDEARAKNINKLVAALNGVEIKPGETLSLLGIAGDISEQNGYVNASVTPDGKKEGSEVGGGVIQVAGTLYNAGLLADMEVVERTKNLWPSEYLAVGLDATLDYADGKDLKLKNNSGYSMFVGANFTNGVLTVGIYGQKPEYEILIENRQISETPAPHAEVEYTDEYPEGEQHVQSISREGREVEIYRHYLENGKTVDSEQVSHDNYSEIRGVILQGTGPVEAD